MWLVNGESQFSHPENGAPCCNDFTVAHVTVLFSSSPLFCSSCICLLFIVFLRLRFDFEGTSLAVTVKKFTLMIKNCLSFNKRQTAQKEMMQMCHSFEEIHQMTTERSTDSSDSFKRVQLLFYLKGRFKNCWLSHLDAEESEFWKK